MASSDYLLKIKTIDGESKQDQHEKWMELQSWSWGESNAGSSGLGGGAGSIEYGISSPKLFLACATGEHIADAELHIRKAGGKQEVFVSWKFTDIVISSYQTGGHGSGSGVLPVDQVSTSPRSKWNTSRRRKTVRSTPPSRPATTSSSARKSRSDSARIARAKLVGTSGRPANPRFVF